MKRIAIKPRDNYQKKIENMGFNFHTDYWKENAYYSFTMKEIEEIEKATNMCYAMYVDAVQHVIDYNLFHKLCIPAGMEHAIRQSWERDDLSLYGRFDFAMIDGVPKLLEFNADTPTSLLEASVVQWQWKEDLFKDSDQFNAIHESLVQSFKDIQDRYRMERYHFVCCRENVEDEETLQYLVAAAMEAGLNTAEIEMEQLNLDEGAFYDPSGERIRCCFKLYPWEWMMNESKEGCTADILWLEPMWKSLMSNKAMLPILGELYPDSPYILKCTDHLTPGMKNYCKKPVFSREGANVTLVKDGQVIEQTGGDYGEEGYVYQELAEIPSFDGKYPVIGSWVIGGLSAGMGIRETSSKVTDNLSEFIPHIIE
jgi:glutathionylspermidine synthase